MDRHRLTSGFGIDQGGPALLQGEGFLFVGRGDAGGSRFDPDLQQTAGGLATVDLAMDHAGAGAHALHLAGAQHLGVAHGIAVVQLPLDHHRDDLHVPVRVHAKPLARGNHVVVDDAQGTKAHPGRVVVAGEGEAVPAVEPIELAVKTLSCGAQQRGHYSGA